MKILVLGASGLLGNTFLEFLKKNALKKNLKVFYTFRKKKKNENFFVFDVSNKSTYKNIKKLRPDFVINCIGAIKPAINEKSANSIISALEVNSKLPGNLLDIFPKAKIIHFNTDCVFSGKKGNYSEDDRHDFNDVYGMTKSLGEIKSNRIMNLRCSIIGVEKNSAKSLVSWFLNNKQKKLQGFTNHAWNGLTTLALVQITFAIITKNLFKSGLFHIIPKNKISKYNLLKLLNDKFFDGAKTIKAVRYKDKINRTLITKKLDFNNKLWNSSLHGEVKSISQMIKEM